MTAPTYLLDLEGRWGANLNGSFAWGFVYVKTKLGSQVTTDVKTHYALVGIDSTIPPDEKILCLKAQSEGFRKGEVWYVSESARLVTCQDCIEYIHS